MADPWLKILIVCFVLFLSFYDYVLDLVMHDKLYKVWCVPVLMFKKCYALIA